MFQQLAGEVSMAAPSSGKPSGEEKGQNQTPGHGSLSPPHARSVPSCKTSPSVLCLRPAACRDGVMTGADLTKSIQL